MTATRKRGRKLLVASLGVAAVSYVGCGNSSSNIVGNLMAPRDAQAAVDGQAPLDALAPHDGQTLDTAQMSVGNLAPPPPEDAQAHPDGANAGDAPGDAVTDTGMAGMGVGNLMAPPPDSGQD